MPDIVPILFIECVVRNKLESLPPKDKTVLQSQSNPLEEECILQTTEVFQMTVLAQCHVKVAHAERKMQRQRID